MVAIKDLHESIVHQTFGNRIIGPGFEPLFVGVMNKSGLCPFFAEVVVVIKIVIAHSLEVLPECRAQCCVFGRTFSVRVTHGRLGIADMDGPHVGNDVSPCRDFNLDPK